nr:MAG TPA: hypothetical protein [Bacteriophage sp.]
MILSSPSYLNVIDTFLGHLDLSVGQSINSDLNMLDIVYISFTELSVSLSCPILLSKQDIQNSGLPLFSDMYIITPLSRTAPVANILSTFSSFIDPTYFIPFIGLIEPCWFAESKDNTLMFLASR